MMEVQEDKELCTSANRVALKPEELEKSLKLRNYLCNKILECELGGEEEKCNDGDEYSTKKFYEISKDGDKVIGKVSLWNVVLAMVDLKLKQSLNADDSDGTVLLYKFMISRNFAVEKAYSMLVDTIIWRRRHAAGFGTESNTSSDDQKILFYSSCDGNQIEEDESLARFDDMNIISEFSETKTDDRCCD